MVKKFWMVKGAGPANAMHESLASAEREAQRLARRASPVLNVRRSA